MPTETEAAEASVVDLRPLIPQERHATVFAAPEQLAQDETFVLINNHAPIPLPRHIEQLWPGRFVRECLKDGPVEWQIAIPRAAAA
ncbi:DUF2249 domain-containing protein [Allgaiera indica]|nr:DUF2249 domain-containing protein [Allgaiera indica]SDX84068.1 Uncharacterized conserved protein, DUF2249 family [Allgaiera indica]